MPEPDDWLTAAQAAAHLGVKPATLYAYVSRGQVRRDRGPDGRSRFSLRELDQTARLPRRDRRDATDLSVESAITAIDGGAMFYRGEDVATLAGTRSFEEVAMWLWVGRWMDREVWRPDAGGLRIARRVQAALPDSTLPLDRLRVSAAALGAGDELRFDTSPEAVVVTGRRMIAALVDGLPGEGSDPGPLMVRAGGPFSGSVAARLWSRLAPEPPPAGGLEALNAALVTVADHEMSQSTLAARLAASIDADPYSVVCVGLSALGGALHAVASLAAEGLLDEMESAGSAGRVIGERLRRGDRLPGLGHRLYPDGDPRAVALLDRLRRAFAGSPRLETVEAVLSTTRARGLPAPNVDFALAALAHLAAMRRGSSEAIFAIARVAGWLGHAIEEYASGATFRPRSIYVGVRVPER